MRFKIASILMGLWGVAQGYYLYRIGAPSASHWLGWALCFIALLLAASLWSNKNWARLLAIGASIFMLIVYGYFTVRHGAPHLAAWVQPALMLALVAILAKSPSNKSLNPDAGRAGAG